MEVRTLLTILVALLTVVPGGGQAVADNLNDDTTPTEPTTPSSDVLERGLLDRLREQGGVIVHATDHASLDEALAERPDLEIRYEFEHIPAAYAKASRTTVETLAQHPDVTFIESANKQLDYHLDSATATSRAREVFDASYDNPYGEPSPALLDDDGNEYNGSGVGIAVVDSGIDGTHPSFDAPGKLQANFLVTDAGLVDAGPYSETSRGHGTRLAGIAAGTGAQAPPNADLRGAAPGSSLYVFSTEPRDKTLKPAISYDWILSNGADADPQIRIVLNGWSCGDLACGDERQAHLKLAEKLAQNGYAVVFPVGNGAGEGLISATSTESTLPTPGVIGVGNHDDEDTGERNECVDTATSRGNAFDPSTWPDVAAPGTNVNSPNAFAADRPRVLGDPGTRVPVTERATYAKWTGTSMAAAHVAGAAALLLQANPNLDGEAVEHILEETAFEADPLSRFGKCPPLFLNADPAHTSDGANFVVGHGLVDAFDAVEMAENFDGVSEPDPSELEEIPGDYIREGAVVTPNDEQTFYLTGEDELSREKPESDVPTVRPGTPEDAFVHRTEIREEITASGALAEVWLGVVAEQGNSFFYCRNTNIDATVAKIHQNGTREVLGSGSIGAEYNLPAGPWLREIPVIFNTTGEKTSVGLGPEPVENTFEPGDELELTVETGDACFPFGGIQQHFALWSDAAKTPSRVILGDGTREIRPGTIEACQELQDQHIDAEPEEKVDCAWIGGARQNVPMRCIEGRYKVEWFGPPGSGALVECNGSVATCQIPADADGWQECTARAFGEGTRVGQALRPGTMSTCTYFTQSGEQVDGEGHCTLVRSPDDPRFIPN